MVDERKASAGCVTMTTEMMGARKARTSMVAFCIITEGVGEIDSPLFDN